MLPVEMLNRVRAWEEAPLLDEIAVNAGYRSTVFNLGLAMVDYERLGEYVEAKGDELAARLDVERGIASDGRLRAKPPRRVPGLSALLTVRPDSEAGRAGEEEGTAATTHWCERRRSLRPCRWMPAGGNAASSACSVVLPQGEWNFPSNCITRRRMRSNRPENVMNRA